MRGQPSRTALGVARRRAAHQVLDHPKIFDDPLALRIAGDLPEPSGHPFDQYMRAFMAVRSRHAEDQLARAVAHGVGQYVVLGAGLDTYAYRSIHPVRVFEVDHPATQEWKRERLDLASIAIPPSMTFVPVDFESQRFAEELLRAGFDPKQPAFFSWLGVIMYLTLEAATETLRFIASLPPASGVTFDYASAAPEFLARRVARAGEPFTLFFDPREIANLLTSLGFTRLENETCATLNARYCSGRTDDLRLAGDRAFIMTAWNGRE